MLQHSQFLATTRFQVLDGLRAISILAVIWHHTAPTWVKGTLASFGAHGVTLFFAISGFLITTLLLREREGHGAIDLKAFYIRRTLRIFPLYFGTLLIYICVVYFFEKNPVRADGFWKNLAYFLTYTSNFFVNLDGRVIFYFSWSLAVEEQFYLIWPSLLKMTKTTQIALAFALTLVLVGITVQIENDTLFSHYPLAIFAGATLALALHMPKTYALCNAVLGQKWSSMVIFWVISIALIYFHLPEFFVHILFVALVGACVLTENVIFSKILKLTPLVYIGSISYGMYMLHMLCKNAIGRLLDALHFSSNELNIFPITVVASIVIAHLSYTYYESQFIKIKEKFIR